MNRNLALLKRDKNNQMIVEILQTEISQEEFDDYMASFSIVDQCGLVKNLYEICVDSSSDLLNFLNHTNINELIEQNGINNQKIVQIANRLLINYCSSMYLMTDKIKHYLLENNNSQEFEHLTNILYDDKNNISYCFFCKMRNYVIHHTLPYTEIINEVNKGYSVVMSKAKLLEDKNWGPAKEYINNQSEFFEIDELIKKNLTPISRLLQSFYSLIAPNIVPVAEKINAFQEKYHVGNFVFVEYENLAQLSNGNLKIVPTPFESFLKIIDTMNKYPNINIKVKFHQSVEKTVK